jgi:large repetitive protein
MADVPPEPFAANKELDLSHRPPRVLRSCLILLAATCFASPSFAALTTERNQHTATLLPNGSVLFVGSASSAETCDVSTMSCTAAAALPVTRTRHTATLLRNGKVLIAGGNTSSGATATTELYDPTDGSFATVTPVLGSARYGHTATLLPNDTVLIAGGRDATGALQSAEIYDPAAGTFSFTDDLAEPRFEHTASLLQDGNVLVVGGSNGTTTLATAEVYSSGSFNLTASLSASRARHTSTVLTDGRVLIVAGADESGAGTTALSGAEIYDPATSTFSDTQALATARESHTATLLPDGSVTIAGGVDSGTALNTIELYEADGATRASDGTMESPRMNHTATLLPSGAVLLAGGANGSALSSTELYDHSEPSFTFSGGTPPVREEYTSTLLPDGRIFIAGGRNTTSSTESTLLYDVTTAAFTNGPSLVSQRKNHGATLLLNGKVYLSAGRSNFLTWTNAQLYTPGGGVVSAAGPGFARNGHTSTLLANGKVLLVGGTGALLGSLYNPADDTMIGTWNLNVARIGGHTATLLTNGQVLIAGGGTDVAELYDPPSRTFNVTAGAMTAARTNHTATLLPGGLVLMAGGSSGSDLDSAELFDPATGTFTALVDTMAVPRSKHAATLLATGKVLLSGGLSGGVALSSAEFFDPATKSFSDAGTMTGARAGHSGTLMSTGHAWLGLSITNNTGELFDPGLAFSSAWRPIVSAINSPLVLPGAVVTVTGNGFLGRSEASGGGSNNSATNHPILFMQRLEGGPSYFIDPDHWSDTTFQSNVLSGILPGHYLAAIITNGIPSIHKYLKVESIPTAHPKTITTAEDVVVSIALSGSDLEGDQLNYTVVVPPAHGQLTGSGDTRDYTPALEYHGPDSFTYKASDDMTESPAVTVNITVTQENDAPILAAIGARSVAAPGTLSFTPSASDAEGDAMSWSATGLPSGASIDPATGLFTWSTSHAQAGDHDVTINVQDTHGASDSETVTITVTSGNVAPVLAAIGNKTVVEGQTLSFTATATDSDSATLTWTATGLPAGASLAPSSGAFAWTPSFNQAATYPGVIISVSDGDGKTDSETITITVTNANTYPVLNSIGDKTVSEGQLLSFVISGTDEDGDPLTFYSHGLPDGASIDTVTGEFQWTPTHLQAGTYPIIPILVEDPLGFWAQEHITITVIDVNVPPTLDPIGNRNVQEGGTLAFTAAATDFDGHTLTWSTTGLPAGATLNATTGSFQWTPSQTQAGTYPNVVISIQDTSGGSDSETIAITVGAVNVAPVLAEIGARVVAEGAVLSFTGASSDVDADTLTWSATGLPAGATLDDATGEFQWAPTHAQAGSYEDVVISVEDAGGAADSETITITVTDVPASAAQSTISVSAGPVSADGAAFATITVRARDAGGNGLTAGGDVLVLSASVGTVGLITDQGDGTYTASITSAAAGTATITGTLNGVAIGGTASVLFQGSTITSLSSSANPALVSQSVTFTATVTSATSGALSGTVTFKRGSDTIGTGPLNSGSASITVSSLAQGTHTITAVYGGSASFTGSTSPAVQQLVSLTPFGAPPLLVATATSTSQVTLTWAPVDGATSYGLLRKTSGGSYVPLATVATNGHVDSSLTANTTYLYKVQAIKPGQTSALSAPDAATTIVFTNPSLAGVTVKTVHVVQLRTAVNAMRAAAGLAPATFADDPLPAGNAIRRTHITDLRTALDAARTFLGVTAMSYTDPTLPASTRIKSEHVLELRQGVQ